MQHSKYDDLSIYFADLARCHPPTPEEMKALGWRWINEGDRAALDEMIRRNLRLVVATVRRHVFRNVSYADFVAEGNLGLIRAAEMWDPARGTRFATYATWWIRQAIRRCLNRSAVPIHVPEYMAQIVGRWWATRARLEQELRRTPCPGELTEALDLAPERERALAQATIAMRATASLPGGDQGDESESPVPEIVDTRRPEDAPAHGEELSVLRRAVRTLDPRSAHVVTCRFGLDRLPPRTLQEIGRELGVTRECIRLIERRALEQLKSALV